MEDINKRLVEVETILKLLENKYLEKIPNEIWEYIKNNKSIDYTFKYDETRELENQNLHIDTIAILTYINMKYLADDNQKNKIEKILIEDEKAANEQKEKLYNPNNVFKNNIKKENEKNFLVNSKDEKWYRKIISFFRKCFNK